MILVHLAHEANMIQEVFYSKSVWNMKHTLIFKGECTSIQHNAPGTILYHYSQWQNGCQVLYKDMLLENKDNFPETQYSTVSHLTDRVMNDMGHPPSPCISEGFRAHSGMLLCGGKQTTKTLACHVMESGLCSFQSEH